MSKSRLVFLILCLPAGLAAQRGIPGGAGAGMGTGAMRRGMGDLRREPGIDAPKLVNAVNLLIEHRQELSLSDAQFARVIAIKRSLDSANAPLMRKVDSVQRLFKAQPIFSRPTAEHRDSVAQGQLVVRETTAALRDNIGDAREKAYALLSALQQQIASGYEKKAQDAIDEEARRSSESHKTP